MNLYAVRYNFFDWNLFINIDLFFLLKSYVIRLLKFRLQRPGNTAMLNVILLGLIWSLLRNLKISCLFPTTVMYAMRFILFLIVIIIFSCINNYFNFNFNYCFLLGSPRGWGWICGLNDIGLGPRTSLSCCKFVVSAMVFLDFSCFFFLCCCICYSSVVLWLLFQ